MEKTITIMYNFYVKFALQNINKPKTNRSEFMKKLNKLFAIIIVILGIFSVISCNNKEKI